MANGPQAARHIFPIEPACCLFPRTDYLHNRIHRLYPAIPAQAGRPLADTT